MRRGLIHTGAWLLATGAAVTFSWWGVHAVMAGTAYDPPRALPIPAAPPEPSATVPTTRPQSSSTHRPSQSQSPTAKKPPEPSRPVPSSVPPASGTRLPSRPSGPGGELKSVNTVAGRVVFSMGKSSATLVSATPASGWAMQVWKDPSWIRVEFTAGGAKLSVFNTWHDHPPMVEIIKS